ncbi:glycerophosphodiester phosphodiesterase GDPDL1-like [Vigna unguiculata]|uniref:glycerophosphodiester phosphodiesterase GDPDL1-like n=1 Tax=Vigna unguiculata TaxID=3917 RepID=UPI0010169E1E|nr:glycerophosphodiester phosphodiesterase GDPDL1-like [Vigna unguiculata]
MWNPRALSSPLAVLLFLLLHCLLATVSAQRSAWKTLHGGAPLVVARGGFSGMFPDSSDSAYNLAVITCGPDVYVWCDVQLTKDGVGICQPDINLLNSTYIAFAYPNKTTSYLVNGVPTTGYFSLDYTFKQLSSVVLTQGVYSRTNRFDGINFPILSVDGLLTTRQKPKGIWLNIQHDAFYAQHNLSMRSFVLSASKRIVFSHISSPEVNFLRGISSRFNQNTTKLVFRFMAKEDVEPSTNQTYESLLSNLTFIKTFASGILVPRGYIWPVDSNLYLLPHTSLVSDAHKAGLEVFGSDFVNDVPSSFNYSYDPLAEYLKFIDNGDFSVDGVLSDFPVTPFEAIGCFSQLGTNATKQDNKTLIISKYGSSGYYPACTDLAYTKAIEDGVDVLDCPVQISKDGTPFCLNSIDLIESTTVAQSSYSKYAMTIPQIKSGSGIFAFNLTWSDIKTLTPSILNPFAKYRLFRNPKSKTSGNLVALSDFLSLTNSQPSLSGVSIAVENAAYLAEKQGLNVVDAVISALSEAGYDKPGSQKVYIQSTDSSVLLKFKEKTSYELVYKIDETVGDAANAAVEDIKKFASAVIVNKNSVFSYNDQFLTGTTKTVPTLNAANLSVFVELFSNEFVSQAWDFFSDATVEINSYLNADGLKIDGIITDYPETADRYRRNKCLNLGDKRPTYMDPVQPGGLFSLITPEFLPPAQAPLAPLTEAEVAEPPLPPVAKLAPAASPSSGTTAPTRNAQPRVAVCFFFSSLAVFIASLLLL